MVLLSSCYSSIPRMDVASSEERFHRLLTSVAWGPTLLKTHVLGFCYKKPLLLVETSFFIQNIFYIYLRN